MTRLFLGIRSTVFYFGYYFFTVILSIVFIVSFLFFLPRDDMLSPVYGVTLYSCGYGFAAG